MAYQSKLQGGQTIIIENQGEQTVIRLESGGQCQSSSAPTGQWKKVPSLFQTQGGAVIEIETESGPVFYAAAGGQLGSLSRAPALDGAGSVNLKDVLDGTGEGRIKPLKPMTPMKPL